MGVRGVRRGNTEQQVEKQIKDAAAALLAVMKLLNLNPGVELSEDGVSYFAAIERRTASIRASLGCSPVSAAGGDEDGPRIDREVAAKVAFDTVKAALESENQYSPLQVAAMAAHNIRVAGEVK